MLREAQEHSVRRAGYARASTNADSKGDDSELEEGGLVDRLRSHIEDRLGMSQRVTWATRATKRRVGVAVGGYLRRLPNSLDPTNINTNASVKTQVEGQNGGAGSPKLWSHRDCLQVPLSAICLPTWDIRCTSLLRWPCTSFEL